jgi:hypothetical protein
MKKNRDWTYVMLDILIYLSFICWYAVLYAWDYITKPFHAVRHNPSGLEKWQRAFPNISEWDDDKKKETYNRYSAELVVCNWTLYSNPSRRIRYEFYNFPNTTTL